MESMNEAVANPYTNPAQAAKFAALTPQDQEWLTRGGGVPNIDDEIILSRAPNKGKPAVAQAANPAAAAPVAQAIPVADPAATTQSVPEPTATVTNGNAATREKLAALLDKLEKTGGAAPQAANPAPSKQLLPVNPSIQAFQQEVLKTDPKAFPKFGADGRKGAEVVQAIAKYPAIAQKYKLTQQAANPAPAAATSAGPADQNVDILGNIINTGVMPESVNYKDDQILLAIKNIKY